MPIPNITLVLHTLLKCEAHSPATVCPEEHVGREACDCFPSAKTSDGCQGRRKEVRFTSVWNSLQAVLYSTEQSILLTFSQGCHCFSLVYTKNNAVQDSKSQDCPGSTKSSSDFIFWQFISFDGSLQTSKCLEIERFSIYFVFSAHLTK